MGLLGSLIDFGTGLLSGHAQKKAANKAAQLQYDAAMKGIAESARQFDVTLRLDRTDPRLRPGTTASVLLQGRRVDRVLQLPLQAVRQKNGKPAVFVQTAAGFEAKEVTVLYRTETRVGLDGIAEGTVVALVDPVAAAMATKSSGGVAVKGPAK